jgi:putative flippase GtrA
MTSDSSSTLQAKNTHVKGRLKRFGAVGILNTLVDYVLFIALTKLLSLPLSEVWIAKLMSGSVAMFNSFYLNRRWVFKSSNANVSGQAARFVVTTLVGVFVIQTGLTQLFSSVFPQLGQFGYTLLQSLQIVKLAPQILTAAFVIKTVAFGLASIGSLTWNYWAYRHLVFHHT